MKRLILLLFIATACLSGYAQTALFKKYARTRGVETVYISKAMLRHLPSIDVGIDDIGAIASKLDYLQVLSCESPSIARTIAAEAQAIYKRERFELVMEAHDDGEAVRIYMKRIDKVRSQFVLLEQEEDEVSIIDIAGRVSLGDIQRIADMD